MSTISWRKILNKEIYKTPETRNKMNGQGH